MIKAAFLCLICIDICLACPFSSATFSSGYFEPLMKTNFKCSSKYFWKSGGMCCPIRKWTERCLFFVLVFFSRRKTSDAFFCLPYLLLGIGYSKKQTNKKQLYNITTPYQTNVCVCPTSHAVYYHRLSPRQTHAHSFSQPQIK